MKSAVIHEQATSEVEDAIAYLNGKRDGLGDEFRDEFETAIGQIRRNPKAFSPYSGDFRKYLMGKRFPFQIFYIEYDSHVWIAAVHHASREPDTWMGRAAE